MDNLAGPYYIGVDIGTKSVRAALFSFTGVLINTSTQSIKIFEPQSDYYEQSSENIWLSTCRVIRSVTTGITDKSEIQGLGFDATCSLVVMDKHYQPLSISPTGSPECDIIMWMDHRAKKQTKDINNTKHRVLNNVGGVMSVEAQLPKIKWIKENLYEQCWKRGGHFMDLVDFLTWKATNSLQRSMCTVSCKWTYMTTDDRKRVGWSKTFFEQIGLSELMEDDYIKIGNDIVMPGLPVGSGLTDEMASALGLLPGTNVSSGLIDAYAGFLGCIGCIPRNDLHHIPLHNRAVLISGTSNCYLSMSETPLYVDGVWGPYYSAVIEGKWINEAGQSAAGKLLDHIITTHPSYPLIKTEADNKDIHIHEALNEVLEFIVRRDDLGDSARLTTQLHLYPDYHGNRSPLADPDMKGMISGLSLGTGVEDLAILYLATVQALAYGVQHIIDSMKKSCAESKVKLLYICGGLSKNKLLVQTFSDVLDLPIVTPNCEESVLLGSAMLGACSSGNFKNLEEAMISMAGSGELFQPNLELQSYHKKKYKVFLKMLDDQLKYLNIMSS